jgi:lysophospholipase L1-like esterase
VYILFGRSRSNVGGNEMKTTVGITIGALAVAVIAVFSTATAFAEVRIVALGSSSIRGCGVPANQSYPAQLEAASRAKGHQVTVTNQGVNGDTTAGILTRLDSAVPPGTDFVILKVRASDQVLYHISSDVSAANVRTIVERLRAKGAEVYLLDHDMQRSIRDRADLHVRSSRPAFNYHLNAAGYAFVVHRTLPAIEALVRKVERRGACGPQCLHQPPPIRTALTR